MKEKYILIFALFIIGSFLGFVHENLLTALKGCYELRTGLIYGPFIPIYGIGLVGFYLIYSQFNFTHMNMAKEFFIIFIIGCFVGGFTEYISSYIQEKVFGTVSWDYTNLRYDINGRTSVFHAMFWGLMSLTFYVFILPFIKKLNKYMQKKEIKIVIFVLSIFIIFDIIISVVAVYRQNERRHHIEPSNKVEYILDKYYPDEYLDKIYNNAKAVK